MLQVFLLTIALALPHLAAASVTAVFAHYLVVGLGTQSEADTDVAQAKAAGFDAFALNLLTVAEYSNITLDYVFTAAQNQDFKLFFSLDMGQGCASNLASQDPSEWLGIVNKFVTSSAYYRVDGRPFLSTYSGGQCTFGQPSVDAGWQAIFQQYGLTDSNKPYFVPNFDDAPAYNSDAFFSSFPSLDGAMSWETAWSGASDGSGNVSDAKDKDIQAQAAANGKVYMMPWSSFQFKHISDQFWYRKGELTLAERIGQILDVQPAYVEFITWNDAGESHYIGEVWPEPLDNESGTQVHGYVDGFDHSGWRAMLPSVISSLKAGASQTGQLYPVSGSRVVGSAWYRTLLTTSTCASFPSGAANGLDAVNYAFLLPAGCTGGSVRVYSDETLIGEFPTTGGLNAQSVPGLKVGQPPSLDVRDANGDVVGAWNGTLAVSADGGSLCNWNYAVGAIVA